MSQAQSPASLEVFSPGIALFDPAVAEHAQVGGPLAVCLWDFTVIT